MTSLFFQELVRWSFPFCLSFRFIYGNKSAPGCAYQKWVKDKQGLGMPRLRHLWPGGKRVIHPESKAGSPMCEVGREGVGLQPGALRMGTMSAPAAIFMRFYPEELWSFQLHRSVDSTQAGWGRGLCWQLLGREQVKEWPEGSSGTP